MASKKFYVDIDLNNNYLNNSLLGTSNALDTTEGAFGYENGNLKFRDTDSVKTLIKEISNGLSGTNGLVSLGGLITQNTILDATTFDLSFAKGDASFSLKRRTFLLSGVGFDGNSGYSIAETSDGKFLIGHESNTWKGENIPYGLVKMDEAGNLDTTFNTNLGTGFDSEVNSIKVQADGKILVAGFFTDLNGTSAIGVIRLNSDGTRDNAFSANEFDDGVGYNAMQLQADGKIVIITRATIHGTNGLNSRLVRLNSDGTLDNDFNNTVGAFESDGFPAEPSRVLVQTDQKIVVAGGYFTDVGELSINGLVRFNSDGTLDTTFNTNVGTGTFSDIYSIKQQSDGKLIISFSSSGSQITFNGSNFGYILRLNTDGTIDSTFNNGGTGFNNDIWSSAIDVNDNIWVMTSNGVYNGIDYGDIYLFQLGPDGEFLQAVNYLDNGYCEDTFFIDSKNRLWMTNYSGYYPNGYTGIETPDEYPGIFRFGQSGVLENNTIEYQDYINVSGPLSTTTTEFANSDYVTKAYVATQKTQGVNGLTDNGLNLELGGQLTKDTTITVSQYDLKIGATGSKLNIISDFEPGIFSNNTITKTQVLPNGKILVAGNFTSLNNAPVSQIILLNALGELDNGTWTSPVIGYSAGTPSIQSFKYLSNGKVIIIGAFDTVDGNSSTGIARLNNDGSYDNTFTVGTGFDNIGLMLDIDTDSNDRIFVVGNFLNYNGSLARKFVCLNDDGTIDTAFMTNVGAGFRVGVNDNFPQRRVVVQSNDRIVVTGQNTQYNGGGSAKAWIINTDGTLLSSFLGFDSNAVDILSDDSIIVTQNSGKRLYKYSSTGTFDSAFDTAIGSGFNNNILDIKTFNDKIYAVGSFSLFNGLSANRIIRLNADGSRDNTFIDPILSTSSLGSLVDALSFYSDGKILLSGIGGGTNMVYNGNFGGGLMRLSSVGTIDMGKISFSNGNIEYDNDYSSVYTDRSLVDKAYVVTAIATAGTFGVSAVTASNGLTKTGSDITLGGELTTDTTILGDGAAFGLTIDQISFVNIFPTNTQIYSNETTNIGTNSSFELSLSDLSENAIFSDLTVSPKGLQYNDDYSANFVDRSLVDKEFVVNQISYASTASSLTASNGLTKNSNDITFGGTLNSSTNILGNNQTLSLGTNPSKLNTLDVYSTNNVNLNSSNGQINLSTTNGHINLTATAASTDVVLTASGSLGNVILSAANSADIQANSVSMYAANGVDINTQSGAGAIFLQADSGNVTMTTNSGNISIQTSSGDVTVQAQDALKLISNDFGRLEIDSTSYRLENYNAPSLLINNFSTGSFEIQNTGASLTLTNNGTGTFDLTNNSNDPFNIINNGNGIMNISSFTDIIVNPGATGILAYDTDRSTYYTNRSLVDKEFVINQIGYSGTASSFTASNGLTKTGNNVKFGGTLSEDTVVSWNGGISYVEYNTTSDSNIGYQEIYLDDENGGYTLSIVEFNGVSFDVSNGTTSLQSQLTLDRSGNIVISSNDPNQGNLTSIETSTTNIIVNSSFDSFAGIEYLSDYSANYTNRSLVDKEYVLNQINIASTSGYVAPSKYVTTITGDNVETDFTITHNLNTYDVMVQVFNNTSPRATVEVNVERSSTTTSNIIFNTAPGNGVEYRVLVIKVE